MKLVPTVISAVCPVCKGKKGKWFDLSTGLEIEAFKNYRLPYSAQYSPCKKCNGNGVLEGVVLAPVGYDGKGEVDPYKKHLDVCCWDRPKKQGHCGECKWWDSDTRSNDSGVCRNGNVPENLRYCVFQRDFGCIYFERKG